MPKKKVSKSSKPASKKKPAPKKKKTAKAKATPGPKKTRYLEAVGRRKTAIARVRLTAGGEKEFLVNGKPLEKYFPYLEMQQKVLSPLEKTNYLDKFKVSVKVKGGGLNAQSEAIRHGISRAIVIFDPEFRKILKKAGFLTRDPRMRERKKFGLKRARRAPQWQKR
ncbi:MAG: 30S ribosomal protein S9 [Candidatus Nealsonbacteria bacterium]|nr:MAG: 30S ribosomal protein S9 [Candidatus Nealsonbacteria bacterium]